MNIEIGVAKASKYAQRESGDSVEIVERPGGGISLVLVDGQGSGAAAKSISLMLAGRATGLINQGVRDSVVARALNDVLLTARSGKVSASVDILTADLKSRTVLLSRNSTTSHLVVEHEHLLLVPSNSAPLGRYPFTKPAIWMHEMSIGLEVWVVSDGVAGAGGKRLASDFPIEEEVQSLRMEHLTPQEMVRRLLQVAVDRDDGRPHDDMTVALMRLCEGEETRQFRELSVKMQFS